MKDHLASSCVVSAVAVPSTRWTRAVLFVVGCVLFALGLVGALMPLMPTTVLWIMAAWCFARSSRRFHQAMLDHRWIGPSLRAWQDHRAMLASSKIIMLCSVVSSVGAAMLWVSSWDGRALMACVGLVLLWLLWRVPTYMGAVVRASTCSRGGGLRDTTR